MAFRFRDLMGSVTLMENDVRRASNEPQTQCGPPSGSCDRDDDDDDQGGTQCAGSSASCEPADKSKRPNCPQRSERQAAELVALQCQIRQLAAAASCPP